MFPRKKRLTFSANPLLPYLKECVSHNSNIWQFSREQWIESVSQTFQVGGMHGILSSGLGKPQFFFVLLNGSAIKALSLMKTLSNIFPQKHIHAQNTKNWMKQLPPPSNASPPPLNSFLPIPYTRGGGLYPFSPCFLLLVHYSDLFRFETLLPVYNFLKVVYFLSWSPCFLFPPFSTGDAPYNLGEGGGHKSPFHIFSKDRGNEEDN